MSLDVSEIRKLEAEAAYFTALTKDLEDNSESTSIGLDEKIKKWSGTIIAVVSVCAGIWGLLFPINNYIQEKRSMLQYQINSQMVDLLVDLDSDSTAISDRSILLLSYYERNSLPLLFYKLERISYFSSENLVTNLAVTIANIYESGTINKKATTAALQSQLEDQIQKIKTSDQIDHFYSHAIYNLMVVIEHLRLDKKETEKFIGMISKVQKELLIMDPNRKRFSSVLMKIPETIIKLKGERL